MAMTFDSILKDLVKRYPPNFPATFSPSQSEPISLPNVDLSTMTAASDFVIRLRDPITEILHVEFQAGGSANSHLDILAFNALLHRNYEVPVHTIVILLRLQAGHSNLNGTVAYTSASAGDSMNFKCEVTRSWERLAAGFLNGTLA